MITKKRKPATKPVVFIGNKSIWEVSPKTKAVSVEELANIAATFRQWAAEIDEAIMQNTGRLATGNANN
jgi:hypothetical protein